MIALMNYIRTVQDFGRCGKGAKGGNPMGIPFISHCVRSSFEGPCQDPEKPVPW